MSPVERVRYFIVTCGRSGSSLLAAALADAGADFALEAPAAWDPRKGQMEHPAIKRAAHHYKRAWDIARGRGHLLAPALEAKWRRARGRSHLARALAAAQYLKIDGLDLVVQPAFGLGYVPRVIVSHRPLAAVLQSTVVGRKHLAPDALAGEYLRVYRQGLVLLRCFGGCAVGYADLARGDEETVRALAATTGLDAGMLATAIARRCEGVEVPDLPPPAPYPEAETLLGELQALRGRVLAPGAPVERAIRARGLG